MDRKPQASAKVWIKTLLNKIIMLPEKQDAFRASRFARLKEHFYAGRAQQFCSRGIQACTAYQPNHLLPKGIIR
jgi:hypothetical protein